MYLDFFGFSEKPFAITPNPHFMFLSKTHKEVFAHLLYGLENRSGFIEITGEVGTGKTTVLRALLAQLSEEHYRVALIFNPSLSALELLRSINREYGLAADALEGGELLRQLNTFLLAENAAGRTVVLIIDEAQNLEVPVLEQIRLLSNLETDTAKLIQIILVGQPELIKVLERQELRQLSQRIIVRYDLQPMDVDDTAAYIAHRLEVVGWKGGELFTPAACRRIYHFSKGLPRLINVLCDRALLIAYTEEARSISPGMIREARSELRRLAPNSNRPSLYLAIAVVLILLSGFGGLLAGRGEKPVTEAEVPSAARRQAVAPAPEPVLPVVAQAERSRTAEPRIVLDPSRLELLQQELTAQGGDKSALAAFNALAGLWEVPPLDGGGESLAPTGLQQAARARGLEMTPYQGDLETLLRLDTPALVKIYLPGVVGRRYLALIQGDGQRFRVVPAIGDRGWLRLEELQGLWSGHAYQLWKNHLWLPFVSEPNSEGPEIGALQTFLQRSRRYSGEITERFDAETIAAVTRFQVERGIAQDGRVGPRTLMLLYQDSDRFAFPRLRLTSAQE